MKNDRSTFDPRFTSLVENARMGENTAEHITRYVNNVLPHVEFEVTAMRNDFFMNREIEINQIRTNSVQAILVDETAIDDLIEKLVEARETLRTL